ncbi:hypothetical protein [Daejeonella lutea]|nr:hypothetical protein [Daejeonella lutea]
MKYVDLKTFFSEEITRLTKQKTYVDKTVSRNGVSESRNNILPDWESELSLFIESDINKPAWSSSYTINNDNSITTYTAADSKLRTRSIKIKKNTAGEIKTVSIVNMTNNALYSSSEELSYSPDSLYQIIKRQDVLFLGNNNYKISGIFK